MEKFHLIGIKGTGMSALASILYDMGYKVSGSDVLEDYFTTKKLKQKGIEPLPFSKENITNDKIYIASSVYEKDNIEVKTVLDRKYPLYYYHEFLEYFFKNKIGVSGTHGKTTTTSLIATLFKDEKIAYLIGDGTGFGVKDYDYFIFEACEYKNHFLKYNFDYLVINNIDYDHPDFFNSIDDVISSFQNAANNSHYLIINNDDENCRKIVHDKKITFGLNDADITAKIIKEHANGYTIVVQVENKKIQFYLPHPGRHMIYNFLAAFCVYYLCGLNIDNIQDNLINFKKPSRRMEEYYYYDNVIIDDYAHHPQEIKACIEGIKQKYPNKELIIVFQPHTYSRTFALANEFSEVLKDYKLYLVNTFTSKRENKNKDFDKQVFKIFPNAISFRETDLKTFKNLHNSIILFLGAGNLDKYIANIL